MHYKIRSFTPVETSYKFLTIFYSIKKTYVGLRRGLKECAGSDEECESSAPNPDGGDDATGRRVAPVPRTGADPPLRFNPVDDGFRLDAPVVVILPPVVGRVEGNTTVTHYVGTVIWKG